MNWTFSLLILTSLATAPAMASDEREKNDRQDEVVIELQILSIPHRYTFQDYLSDLAESTRITDINPKNPVRQLEARRHREYKPLNPIVMRW